MTSLQIAAKGRTDVLENKRRGFYICVNEFQNFAAESFATIISEARKYRLNLSLANQYLAWMVDQKEAALFGNLGTLLAFKVGTKDAGVIAEQFGGESTPQDLMTLPRDQA